MKVRGEDFVVIVPPEIQAILDADPAKAAFVRECNARLRQALDGVDTADQEAVDRAMRSIGAVPFGGDDDVPPTAA